MSDGHVHGWMRAGACSLVLLGVSPLAQAATPYDDLQPGEWRVISNNTIEDVEPCPTHDCSYSAVEGVSGVIGDWCGGAFASEWGTLGGLIAWGGGHNGYFGSEVYLFDLETGSWQRLSDPYDNGQESVAPDCSPEGIYPDGSACPAHTYDRVDYHPSTNSFVILSGTPDPVCGGCDDGYVHLFDLDTLDWRLGPQVPEMTPLTGALSAYDPGRDLFWFLGTYYYPPLRAFDPNAGGGAGVWTTYGDPVEPIEIDGAAEYQPERDLLLYVDARGSHKLFAFDLANPDATSVALTTSGDDEIMSREKLGLTWDPVSSRMVAWDDGADVYTLEAPAGDWATEPWLWTRIGPAASNTVVPQRGENGTYSRFRYVPSVNAFILVSATDGPVWLYKLNDAVGSGPNPPGGGGSGTSSGVGGAGAGGGAGDPANSDAACGCQLPGGGGRRELPPVFASLGLLLWLLRRRRGSSAGTCSWLRACEMRGRWVLGLGAIARRHAGKPRAPWCSLLLALILVGCGDGNPGGLGGGGRAPTGGGGGGAGAPLGLPAFPGAEGFGTDTPGGRGGRVIAVTTLDWEGPGSFSEALYATGPRIIVFRVSGVIEVTDLYAPALAEEQSFVTVAGQTSPGGITFRGGGTALSSYHSGFHDGVFRFLRFRGRDAYDNISFNESHHLVLDHCDFSGATDETFDITFSHDFTVQWSTITNSDSSGQNYGQLIAYPPTSRISMHHNLSAHHVNRCGPHFHWGDGDQAPEGGALIDYRNNVIYNCQFEKGLDVYGPLVGELHINLVGNYAKAGPDTPDTAALVGLGDSARAYLEDNVYEPGLDILTSWSEPVLVDQPFDFPPVATQPAGKALERVLNEVGAWPRDAMNERTIGEVRAGTGTLGKLDDPLIESGPEPPPDADLDGMPDDWEVSHHLDPNDPADATGDQDGDGYTNVEEYLNELAAALIPSP